MVYFPSFLENKWYGPGWEIFFPILHSYGNDTPLITPPPPKMNNIYIIYSHAPFLFFKFTQYLLRTDNWNQTSRSCTYAITGTDWLYWDSPENIMGSVFSPFFTWSDSPVRELSSTFKSLLWIINPSAGNKSPKEMKRTDIRHNLNKNATLQDHISKTKKNRSYILLQLYFVIIFSRGKKLMCAPTCWIKSCNFAIFVIK